jgi:hypothetical protein
MSKMILIATFAAFALALFVFSGRAPAQQQEGNKRLFHVVSLKFKEGTTKEQIKKVEDAFAALREQIPGIAGMTWGTNVSPEKHDKGFTHCFILVFNTEKDRDEYLVHDDHKKFGAVLGPVLGDVFVIDFWGDAPRRRN